MGGFQRKTAVGVLLILATFVIAGLILYLEKPTGTVIGVVQTSDGKPLPKARVEIDAWPKSRKAYTDAQGAFRFEQVPLGNYYVSVGAKGYQHEYLSREQKVEEGQVKDLGVFTLKELAPNLSVSIWSDTKLPDEKAMLSLSGAKVRDIHFIAYRVDLVPYLSKGGKFEDLQKPEFDPKTSSGMEIAKEWDATIPDDEIPEFDRKEKVDLSGAGLFLIHSIASSTDRKQVFTNNLFINKTDVGFVAKRDESRIVVYASSFVNPAPVSGAKVYLFPAEGSFQELGTGDQGLSEYVFADPATQSDAQWFVVVKNGASTAFSYAPSHYADDETMGEEPEAEGEAEGEGAETRGAETQSAPAVPKKYKGFVYTERPIYRPGNKVYFKGILRTENQSGLYDGVGVRDVPVNVTNPRGDIVFEGNLKSNVSGSFWGDFDLDEEADLGLYTVTAQVGGSEFRRDFEVDEYRKPEFKVEIKSGEPRYFSGDKITFLIDTQYYSGVPVEASLEYTVYKSLYYPDFYGDDFPSYMMGEEEFAGGYGEVVEEGKAKTDPQGHATVSLLSAKADEDYRYTLRVTAKDITEKTVTTEGDALVTAGDFFFKTTRTEFLALPKKPYPLGVESLDYDEKPVSRDYEIKIEREKWDPIAGEYTYKKVAEVKGKTGADGRGKSEITVDQGGYYRLSISGKDSKGRKVAFKDHLWVTGSTADTEDYGLQKGLNLIADKKKYEAGETAKLLVVAPVKDQSVLISIEGSRIHEYRVEKLNGFSKEILVTLKKEWIPTAYVSVAAIGKKEYYEETTKIAISPKEHYLNVEIQPNAEKFHPADSITYKVVTKDASGKPVPSEISLGVVDESIYALRKDSTDIKDYFWGPKPNRVGTTYSFSGYYSGGIGKEDKNLLRRNFKDTAFWNPVIMTDAQGEATVSFPLPDNLTTWRATVVAADPFTDVGQQINKVISSKDLIVRIATPRFFMERDRMTLKAVVSNYTDQDQTLKVSLGLEGGIEFADAKENQDRSIAVGPKKTTAFEFTVLPKLPGDAKIQLLAKNDKISDGVELKIPILPHGIEEHQYAQGEAPQAVGGVPAEGGGAKTEVTLTLPPKTDAAHSKLKVTLDTTLVAQLLGSLSYLVDYPYGCVEQTTSRLLPALMVMNLYQTLGLTDPTLEKKIPKVVTKGIRRLEKFQHADGGWGWWKDDETDPFMTAYALYALIRANEMGRKVNAQTLERGKKGLSDMIQKGLPGRFAQMANRSETLYFIYYVASLGGAKVNPPLPSDLAQQSRMSLSLLILALQAQGRQDLALNLEKALERSAVCQGGLCHYSDGDKYYRGDAEVTAWALMALLHGPQTDPTLKDSMVKWLMKDRKGGIWRHTRETAAVLYALAGYSKDLPAVKEGVKANLFLNQKELEKVNVASPHFVRNLSGCKGGTETQPVRCVDLKEGKNSLGIENLIPHSLYYQTDLGYFTQEEDLAPSANGIQVKREYVRLEKTGADTMGDQTFKTSELKGKIKKGEVIGVRVTLETQDDLSYLVVEDPLPSGFEVIKDARFDPKAVYYADTSVRDEKIALFSDYLLKGKHVFVYALRPELSGVFHVMPTQSYEMYRPEIRGSGAEAKLEVE